MSIGSEIAIVALLILLNGFFAMSELAIVSARRGRLRPMAEEGHKGAQLVLDLADNPSSFLSIVQIGMTLNSVLLGAFSGATLTEPLTAWLTTTAPFFAPHGEAIAMTLTVAGASYLNLVFGELVPKRIGLAYAEIIAVRAAHGMSFFAVVAAPIVWILARSTDIILRLLGLHNPPDQRITEEEIKDLIAEGTESGALKPAEKDMLEGVMRLANRTVRSIMTPRMDVTWLNIDDPPTAHKEVIRASGYSRFPVARGDMEEILGIVHAKDLLNASFEDPNLSLHPVMRPPLMVPDTTPVLRLLEQFKRAGKHIALVVDEYGSVEGVVTLTDILETITGALEDGSDQQDSDRPIRREDGSWLLDGMTPVDEVEALTRLRDMRGSGDFQTIAGFIIDHLARLPVTGDHFVWEGARFEVVDIDGRRIDKVLVTPPVREEKEEEAEAKDRPMLEPGII